MNAAQSGWYPDPYGRHQRRYYDGNAWTEHVADAAGNQTTDPAPLAPRAPQSPPTVSAAQSPPSSGGWGAPQPTSQHSTPPQQAQPFQQPGYAPAGGGFGAAPTTGTQSTSRHGPLTSNVVGAVVALAGAVVTFIGTFSLKWLSVSADDATEKFSRKIVGASLLHNDFDLDVNFFSKSFFQYGWVITLVVGGTAVVAALVRQGALRLLAAGLALVCAVWTLLGAMGAASPWEDGVEQLPNVSGDASASLQLGVWFTVIGIVVAGAGAVIAFSQESRPD